MSVYTVVDIKTLKQLMMHYSLGLVQSLAGIQAGTVNSNYWLFTDKGRYILTVYEILPQVEVNRYLLLTQYLKARGVACAQPIADKSGQLANHHIQGKPCAIIECLRGGTLQRVQAKHCSQIGAALARLHLSGASYPDHISDPMGINWRKQVVQVLWGHLGAAEQNLIIKLNSSFERIPWDSLPHGIIHADLFRDNALFDNGELTGIIDFYYACHGAFLYDLVITINDWCYEENGQLNLEKQRALLLAYEALRPLTVSEQSHFKTVSMLAAMRFWLSRLEAKLLPRSGPAVLIKDPEVMRQRILLLAGDHF
jgi:homoserine kinase type II